MGSPKAVMQVMTQVATQAGEILYARQRPIVANFGANFDDWAAASQRIAAVQPASGASR